MSSTMRTTLFQPALLHRLRNRLRRTWNVKIDKHAKPLAEKDLDNICPHRVISLTEVDFKEWLGKTSLPFRDNLFPHKKALEFFFTQAILDPAPEDHVMDAAGGRSGYLEALRTLRGCRHLYLTDHIYDGHSLTPDGYHVVGGDISSIELPDNSLTRISCHHAFEHFKGDRDSGFIKEIARLLRPGGKACIIPAFLTTSYVECWNERPTTQFDPEAEVLMDRTASIPGAEDEGYFARFYSMDAFKQRVLDVALSRGLEARLITCKLDGRDIPDMVRNFGSALNCPMRALVLSKPILDPCTPVC